MGRGNSELVSRVGETSDVPVELTERRCKRQTDEGLVPTTLILGRLFHLSVPLFSHLYRGSPSRIHLRGLGGLNRWYMIYHSIRHMEALQKSSLCGGGAR